MKFTIGHVLIKTYNFREAVKNFEKLGFGVTFGGVPDKATNALIYFKNGTFLELYDSKMGKWIDPAVPFLLKAAGLFDKMRADRYKNYTSSPEGINEYALDSVPKSDYRKNIAVLSGKGYGVSKSYAMKRTDPAGNELHWEVTFSADWRLPFFMSEYRPKIKRSDREVNHENEVTGIRRLVVSADDFSYFKDRYDRLFGKAKEEDGCCVYMLEEKEICLRKGVRYGIEEIWLKGKQDKLLDAALTHGAKIYIRA